jgi:Hint module
MDLLYSILIYLSVFTQLSSLSFALQDDVFKSIFNRTYHVSYLNATNGNITVLPNGMCSGLTWNYTSYLETDNGTNTFRVPHSRIYVDGEPCGKVPANATEDELWLDKSMLLVPATALSSQSAADKVYAGALYRDLHDPNDRHGLARVLYYELLKTKNPVWIGYEGIGERVCGEKVIFPRTTFILFSQTLPGTSGLDISNCFKNATTPVLLRPGEQFHVVLDEPFNRTLENPNRVCPAVQTEQKINNNGIPPDTGNSSTSCFPSSAQVTLENGSKIRISDTTIGSRIMDVDGSFSDIFMFTHRDTSSVLHSFVHVRTANNFTLTTSPGHYVYTTDGLVAAESLTKGSVLLRSDGSADRVVEKFKVLREGLHNPQTLSGSLVIDGFAVSAYTTAIAPSVAHSLLAPIRVCYRKSWSRWFIRTWLGNIFANGSQGISWLLLPLPIGSTTN